VDGDDVVAIGGTQAVRVVGLHIAPLNTRVEVSATGLVTELGI